MQTIRKKLATNQSPGSYIIYCISFMAYGCVITGFGPLIPYLSEITGYSETDYSFILLCRSLGFITGALTLKYLEKYFRFHTILVISSLLIFVLLTAFCFILEMNKQGLIMFLGSMVSCHMEVIVNMCILQTQKQDIQFWMLICHGIFGIGGLIGPIFVYLFEIYSYLFMGVIIAAMVPFYYFMKSPENHQKIVQKIQRESAIQQINNAGHQGAYPAVQQSKQSKTKSPNIIGKQIEYLVCIMFFLQIGLQVGFGCWISSYAVLQNIATKEQATKYTSIFWISMTVFRFISPFYPAKSMRKLILLSYSLIIMSFTCVLLVFMNMRQFACLFGSLAFGLSFSAVFPLLLAMPSEYNMRLTSQQNSLWMVWVALGEGLLAMILGYFMQWFSNDWFFYGIAIMAVAYLGCTQILKQFYEKEYRQNMQRSTTQGNQLKQKLVKQSV